MRKISMKQASYIWNKDKKCEIHSNYLQLPNCMEWEFISPTTGCVAQMSGKDTEEKQKPWGHNAPGLQKGQKLGWDVLSEKYAGEK